MDRPPLAQRPPVETALGPSPAGAGPQNHGRDALPRAARGQFASRRGRGGGSLSTPERGRPGWAAQRLRGRPAPPRSGPGGRPAAVSLSPSVSMRPAVGPAPSPRRCVWLCAPPSPSALRRSVPRRLPRTSRRRSRSCRWPGSTRAPRRGPAAPSRAGLCDQVSREQTSTWHRPSLSSGCPRWVHAGRRISSCSAGAAVRSPPPTSSAC
mmetsp:Transcript_52900/g.140405  ORF Transcript_52900/g.140405 Transcript_52900/m.140405 type:complete len:209 (-) Transcript_52900:572-1198(-)